MEGDLLKAVEERKLLLKTLCEHNFGRAFLADLMTQTSQNKILSKLGAYEAGQWSIGSFYGLVLKKLEDEGDEVVTEFMADWKKEYCNG